VIYEGTTPLYENKNDWFDAIDINGNINKLRYACSKTVSDKDFCIGWPESLFTSGEYSITVYINNHFALQKTINYKREQ